jgi:hypothetical protein
MFFDRSNAIAAGNINLSSDSLKYAVMKVLSSATVPISISIVYIIQVLDKMPHH